MSNEDKDLREQLKVVQASVDRRAPAFDTIWQAAERQAKRRRIEKFAGLAAAAAIGVFAFGLLTPVEDEFRYVDMDALMESTSWSAPSDSLLPEHQFDIYQEIPWRFESTESNGGALL